MSVRIGIDVGGTFTDIVCIAGGQVITHKVSSTGDDYSRSIAEALPALLKTHGLPAAGVSEVIHGTTVATNAILQRSGSPTALITTRGFRDVLELRRIRMPEMYNWNWDKPPDLIERRFRFEVTERMDAHGSAIIPVKTAELAGVVDRIASFGLSSIAVCLINSYANPAHEELIRDHIAAHYPGISVSISSDLVREAKEYERTATVAVNAYVRPLVATYIDSLQTSLTGIEVDAPLLIMQSNGGVMTAEAAAQKPVFIIESGPAAGVIASQALSTATKTPNLITFDMGGTTAKASIIEDGEISQASEYEVGSSVSLVSRLIKGGGHLIRIPAIDIAEIGAGGGSIAHIDSGNALQVGPRSAGSNPGPACYSRGGTEPTITDANLLLGYLNAGGLAGGGVPLDAAKSERALHDRIAKPLCLSLTEAAYGVHLLANANMIRAVRSVSTERGRDVRDFSLVAFGGSGPLHACQLARSIAIPEGLVPPHAGLFSAFGLLGADIAQHSVHSFYKRTDECTPAEFEAAFERMEADAGSGLVRQGFRAEEIRLRRSVDMRYAGQSYDLTIDAPGGTDGFAALEQRFDDEHERTYGHRAPSRSLHAFSNLRLVATIERPRTSKHNSQTIAGEYGRGTRRAYFGKRHGWIETSTISRAQLAGEPVSGPLLVDEYDTTIVVAPGCVAQLDIYDVVRIAVRGESE